MDPGCCLHHHPGGLQNPALGFWFRVQDLPLGLGFIGFFGVLSLGFGGLRTLGLGVQRPRGIFGVPKHVLADRCQIGGAICAGGVLGVIVQDARLPCRGFRALAAQHIGFWITKSALGIELI